MALSAAKKHLFYFELSKLLAAGFDIRKAAASMLASGVPDAERALLDRMEKGLAEGRTITDALTDGTTAISELERGIIAAGERSGRMAPAFRHLADYFGMVSSATRTITRSMIYPLIVLHMGILVGTAAGPLQRGEAFSKILPSLILTLLVFYAGTFVLYLAGKTLLKAAETNPSLDGLVNRLPWVGKARRNLAMARFTKVYHTCLLAGLGMQETASTAAAASHSGLIREAGLKVAEAATQGGPLGPEFIASSSFPNAFSRSYATAEESGTLDQDLDRWAGLFQSDAEQAVTALGVAVPKVLYACIVIFVGWKIVSFYGGYLHELDNIGNDD
ncbi:type II secretion system F family protein [Luteolibacter ambystomatis]|uniref:Type II secretion system F family protein n=1 Tax=Luteolibacter ambystomatis TaxID=2824561 RepID=A0A975G6M1_9BACT|nr:type II secretion system F family protein [Luteolibacter ambystomatis]QUE49923.1 type II secretion system F family protein [Luteolibacter ambystomatis]